MPREPVALGTWHNMKVMVIVHNIIPFRASGSVSLQEAGVWGGFREGCVCEVDSGFKRICRIKTQ